MSLPAAITLAVVALAMFATSLYMLYCAHKMHKAAKELCKR